MKIGAFAGKFAPLHLGHIQQILACSSQVDELRVVLCENPKKVEALFKQSGLPNMDKALRLKWLKETFKNHKNIKVLYMDETGLESFPKDMQKWADRFRQVAGSDVNVKFADETYRELNEKYFLECEFICFDRGVLNISATKIRSNPKKYLSFIAPAAQSYFKKILKEKEE